MSDDRSVPTTIEQLCVNNMVNIETLLECLIESGVVKEDVFTAMKQKIEARIIAAQQAANATADQQGD
ncbi:MAG: hypothetical protein KDB07_02290 [Planctomycetes bacterium]|nr:hypothetical protein [Planctomycetota bacterium]